MIAIHPATYKNMRQRFSLLAALYEDFNKFIPEPTARSAVPGVSPGRGLLTVHKRSSKSLFMGDGDEIFFGRS